MCNAGFMAEHLKYFSAHFMPRTLNKFMDIYSAHRNTGVLTVAVGRT